MGKLVLKVVIWAVVAGAIFVLLGVIGFPWIGLGK